MALSKDKAELEDAIFRLVQDEKERFLAEEVKPKQPRALRKEEIVFTSCISMGESD